MRSKATGLRSSRNAAANNFLLVPFSALVVFALAYVSLDRAPVDALAGAYRAAHFESVLPMEAFWPLLHFAIYTALTFLAYQVLRRSVTPLGVGALIIGIGLFLECAQAFTATRSFELIDITANVFGAWAGIGLGLIYDARRRRR